MRQLFWQGARFQSALVTILTLASMAWFQNCSNVDFSSIQASDNKLGDPPIVCDPLAGENTVGNCGPNNGLKGKIYYFLNKDSGANAPSVVFDRFNSAITFPGGINSVNQFFERGIMADVHLVLSRVFIPVLPFTTGFKDSNGDYLLDQTNKKLIEAFGFRVEGGFRLPSTLAEGFYEFALLSDDGAVLSADLDGSGFTILVDNDGTHSAKLGCSTKIVDLKHNRSLPLRLDYYQGPRVDIALTLLVRHVPGGESGRTLDPKCGYASRTAWFVNEPSSANYAPNYTDGEFGALINRGWFVPETQDFKN